MGFKPRWAGLRRHQGPVRFRECLAVTGFRGAVMIGLSLLIAGSGWGQQPHADCTIVGEDGKTVVWPNCVPPAGEKSHAGEGSSAPPDAVPAAKRFPFPGEPPAADAGANAPGATTANPAAIPAGGPANPETGKAAPPVGGGLQDAGSSGNATAAPDSSSSSSSSTAEGGSVGPLAEPDEDEAAKDAAARKAARHKLPPVARQSPDERVAEDLSVADFYQTGGNFRGAYGRATDAVSIAGDDPNARFALAEAARKLGKLDEALVNYKKCLTLDPVPKVKKAAEKALKEMSGG
jgi:hypothetical protein